MNWADPSKTPSSLIQSQNFRPTSVTELPFCITLTDVSLTLRPSQEFQDSTVQERQRVPPTMRVK